MKDRIALVIGNSNYVHAGILTNPQNDANDIESVLNRLNFDVTKVTDTSLIDLQQAINTFLQDLDEYAVGLLFYAGHGMQIDRKNYIVPVDLMMSSKSRTQVSCYCFNSFLDEVAAYKGKTIICVLDACRTNPFVSNRGFTTGFAPFNNPPKGTIIAYSTSADCGAYDGMGSNGLYTQVLKDALLIPNIKIEDMFKSVRNKVSEISLSQYGEEQLSWEYSSLVGDFYFSVTSQPVNANISDEELYRFICDRQKHYEETTNDIYDIECMPYVDAYKRYQIPIIKALRAYSRLAYQEKGYQFSDATIDEINIKYLSSWGFKQMYGRWYYKDHYVEMGDLLPLPDELKPKKPLENQGLEIEILLKSEYENGKLRFEVASNIPDQTPIIFTLKGRKYTAQCKTTKNDSLLMSDWFSDKGNAIKNGFYTVEVSCPIDRVLPDNVRKIFGERNRNIYGRCVKFDPIGGNTIHFSCGLLVKNEKVQIIDMQQKISEL